MLASFLVLVLLDLAAVDWRYVNDDDFITKSRLEKPFQLTPVKEAILEDIRDRSRRVIWLNPETEMFWYSGDSEMRIYEGLCDEVRPCANLNQLTEFIRELVL